MKIETMVAGMRDGTTDMEVVPRRGRATGTVMHLPVGSTTTPAETSVSSAGSPRTGATVEEEEGPGPDLPHADEVAPDLLPVATVVGTTTPTTVATTGIVRNVISATLPDGSSAGSVMPPRMAAVVMVAEMEGTNVVEALSVGQETGTARIVTSLILPVEMPATSAMLLNRETHISISSGC